jgi:transcriptional regulator GlxA family with amidase domain
MSASRFAPSRDTHSKDRTTASEATQTRSERLSDVSAMEEQHYSVQQLADRWGLSTDFVRRVFAHEAGVTEWVQQSRGKRRYRVLRIPRSVAERVYRHALASADSDGLSVK